MSPRIQTELSNQIVGQQLSGVTFVMDYLQLQFNPPPIINAYTPVTVISGGLISVSGEDQFRNRLCDQITRIVKSVALKEEEALVITFEDASVISISLKPSDYVGPEALSLMGRDDLWLAL